MEGFNMPAIPKLDSVPHSESDSDHARKVSRVRRVLLVEICIKLTMEESGREKCQVTHGTHFSFSLALIRLPSHLG